jgi:hypothetical protein
MRVATREELDYVRATVSDKRPLCWWCSYRPKKDNWPECGAGLDWRECAAMERSLCKKFLLDFNRIGNAKEPEAWYRVKARSEQISIDFTENGK